MTILSSRGLHAPRPQNPLIWLGLSTTVAVMVFWPLLGSALVPARTGGDPGPSAGPSPAELMRLHLESSLTGMAVTTANSPPEAGSIKASAHSGRSVRPAQ